MRKQILKRFGHRLKKLRERKGISQDDFAVLSGLHRTGIGKLERGKRIPRLDTLVILSHALKISMSELVRGVERWGRFKRNGR